MSSEGMHAWIFGGAEVAGSEVVQDFFEYLGESQEDSILKDEWALRRESFNRNLVRGRHPGWIIGQKANGSDAVALFLVMVFLEDSPVGSDGRPLRTVADIPAVLKKRSPEIRSYIIHQDGGFRALPLRERSGDYDMVGAGGLLVASS